MANNLDINLDGLTESVNRFVKTLDVLEKRFESLGEARVFASAFGTPKEVDSYVNSINRLDKVASNTFKNLIKEITRLQQVAQSYSANEKGAGGLTMIVNELLKLERQIGEIGDNSFSVRRVTSLFELVAIINTKMIGLNQVNVADFSNLENVTSLYRLVARSVKKLIESIDSVQNVDYNKIKAFTDILSFIQIGVGKAINKGAKVAGVEDFRRVATALANLSQAIPKIIQELQNIPNTGILFFFTKQRRQLVGFFNTVGFILNGVAKAVRKAKLSGDEAKKVRGMATALLDISKAIPQLIRDSQQLPALAGWFRVFSKSRRDFGSFLNSIRFILQQLGKIKVKKDSVQGISGIADFLEKIRSFDWRSFDYEGMDEFTKRTEASFGRLSRINRFNMPSMPKAPRGSRNSYGGRGDAGVIQSAQSFAGQLPNALTIAKGVLIRDAVVFAMRNLGQFARFMIDYRAILLRSLKNIGDTLRRGGQELTNIGQGLLMTFSPTKIFQSRGLQLATDFQAISTQLEIFGNLTKEQVANAQALANEIGIQFPLSANEALSSVLDLIKAGRTLEEVQFLLPASASLASLSESGDLDMVTKFLINAGMNVRQVTDDIAGGFGSVAAVTDVIFQAANATTASVDGLIQGMEAGIPAGKALGLTFEQTAAALAILEDAGRRGSEAGTALRTFEAALSKMKGNTFQEKLQSALALTDDRKFGDTLAVQTLRIFRDAQARGGIDALVEQFQGMGSASDASVKSLDNLKGEIVQLQGSFETALNVALLPTLERFFRPIVKVARAVVDGFIGLDEAFRETLVTTTLLTGALGALSGAVLLTTGLVMRLSGGFTSLVASAGLFILKAPLMIFSISSIGAATITTISSITLLAGGLLAIGATVTKFYRAIENNVGGAGDAFKEFASSVGGFFGALREAFSGLQNAFAVIFGGDINADRIKEGERLSDFFGVMTEKVNALTDAVKKFDPFKFLMKMRPLINQLREGFSDISAGILGVISGDDELAKQGARGIATYGRIASRTLGNIFGVGMEDAIYSFDTGNIIEGAKRAIKNLISGFNNAVENNKDQIVSIAETLFGFLNPFNKISGFFRILGLDSLADTLKSVGNTITDILGGIVGGVIDIFNGESLSQAVSDNFGQFGEDFVKTIIVIGNTIRNAFKGIFDFVSNIGIGEAVQNIVKSFDSIFSGRNLNEVIQNISSFFATLVGEIGILILNLPSKIANGAKTLFEGLIRSIGSLGSNQEAQLLTAVDVSFFRLLGRAVGLIAKRVGDFALSVGREISKAFIRIYNYIVTGGESVDDTIIESIDAMAIAKEIARIFSDIISSLSLAIGDFIAGVGDAFGSGFLQGIGEAIGNLSIAKIVKYLLDFAGQIVSSIPVFALSLFSIDISAIQDVVRQITNLVGNLLTPVINGLGGAIEIVFSFFNILTSKNDSLKGFSLIIASGVLLLTNRFFGLSKALSGINGVIGKIIPGWATLSDTIVKTAKSIKNGVVNLIKAPVNSLADATTSLIDGFRRFSFKGFASNAVGAITSITKAFLVSPFFAAVVGGAALSSIGTAMKKLSDDADGLGAIATFLKEIIYNIASIFGMDRSQLSWIEDIFSSITTAIRDVFDYISIELDRILPGRGFYNSLQETINVGTQIVTQDPSERRTQLDSQLASDYDLLSEYQAKYQDLAFETVRRGEGESPELLFSSIGFDVSESDLKDINALVERINRANNDIMRVNQRLNEGVTAMTPDEQLGAIESYFEAIANQTEYGTKSTEVLRNRRDSLIVSFDEMVAAAEANGQTVDEYFQSLIDRGEGWRITAVTSVMEGAGMMEYVAQTLGRDSTAFGLMFNSLGKQNQRKYINDYLEGSFRVDLQNTTVPDDILKISQDLQSRLRDGLIDEDFYAELSDELAVHLEEIYTTQLASVRQMTGGMTEGAVIESFGNEFEQLEVMPKLVNDSQYRDKELKQQILETAASIDLNNQEQIDTFNTFIDSVESLDETEKTFYKTLAVTNRDFVKGLFPDVETIKETRAQEESIDAARSNYEEIIDLAKELESGAVTADNIAGFVERLLTAGGAEEANTEAYGVVLAQLRALEEAGVLTEGTANAVDNYFRLVRQGRASLDGLGLSQSEYNKKLAEYLRLQGAVDKKGNIVLPETISATGATPDEATQEMQTRLQEMQTEFDAEIADFDKEYLDKEKERQAELLELESEFKDDEIQREQDYNNERKRALQDHLREMKRIGDTDFKDAVANRNAASALEALQRQRETKEQFDIESERAAEDKRIDDQRRLQEYNNKVAKIREQIGLDFHQYHVERQAKIQAYQQRLRDEGLYDLYMRNMQQKRIQELVAFAEKLASPFVSAAQRAATALANILNPIGPKQKGEVKPPPMTSIIPGQTGLFTPGKKPPIVIPPFGGGFAGARKNGGNVFEGKRYSIIEDGKPELFTPGKTGRITSYKELQNLMGGNGRRSSASMSGGVNVTVDLSNMQFNGMTNPDEIYRTIETKIVTGITKAIRGAM